ncbi:ABC transporter permease [Serpentinicella alkaliphila]|uniref:Nucleoside ABC transporter membrane protein n=1 Tax=Serpentinicella alkaliphila TaxID=1734049 RepID=A0A4R2TFI7_9FIRM|nr:ABC transporter permease [Serpentinicella alkaliphila]QUH25992.1 ABC transporter permease [Serpentinicella alkaliphila]TCQ02148.1 nucleoside ABC transporter membrane protein [Serpentinicella alkaliphila]
MLNNIALIISITLMYSTPLIYAALGGVISEKSGVVNIGLEGMMTIGAFAGAATGALTGNPWLAFLVAGLSGGIFGLLHAIASVTFHANQVVSGIAINFLAPGLALFISRRIFNGATMTPLIPLENKMPLPFSNIFRSLHNQGRFGNVFARNSIVDLIFNQYVTVYIAFILVAILWFLLYKTKFGLRIRAVGEHPKAADTLGVNVYGLRYFCVIASGVLAGLGGASLSLAIVSTFRATLVSGQGFIALAAVIFGKWKPQGALAACLLFGLATGLRIYLGGSAVGLDVSQNLLSMLPYVITLVVLVGFVGKAVAPASVGLPYEKSDK